MNTIYLVAVTAATATGSLQARKTVRLELLDELAGGLARFFCVSCHVRPDPLDAGFAFDRIRNQYHSTAILQRMAALAGDGSSRWLSVTTLDLFVPILTFVFGEAQVEGRCAVISSYRLREEFYGLPPRPDLLHERLLKEAIHELGHTFGLRHCHDWRCVMASAHSVERLDLRSLEFCAACRAPVLRIRAIK